MACVRKITLPVKMEQKDRVDREDAVEISDVKDAAPDTDRQNEE